MITISNTVEKFNLSNMANIPFNLVNDDLRKIAKEISVQVLTHQPENIYKFTANYLTKQLDMREKKDIEIFIHDLIDHDLTYEAMLKRRGVSLEVAHKASSVMQGAVRRFLLKQKARTKNEKIEMTMESTAANLSIDNARTSAAVILQKESPPGDAKPLKPPRVSSSSINSRLLSVNSGISKGDIIRTDGPAYLRTVQNMGAFDEEEEALEVDDELLSLEIEPIQESDENATKFAESVLMDILSGIFESDALLNERSFGQEMEHMVLVDEGEILTQN